MKLKQVIVFPLVAVVLVSVLLLRSTAETGTMGRVYVFAYDGTDGSTIPSGIDDVPMYRNL